MFHPADLALPALALARDVQVSTLAAVATALPGHRVSAIDVSPPSADTSDPDPNPSPDTVIVTMTPTSASSSLLTTATRPPEPGSPDDDDDGQSECRLLGPFAIVVQLALGGLALLALVYKRWRERPQRPLKIWFFDASKQVFGSMLTHVANVFMSMLTSGRFSIRPDAVALAAASSSDSARRAVVGGAAALGLLTARADDYVPNPCSFYLLNLAIDVCVCS
jgi:hypothetical protein